MRVSASALFVPFRDAARQALLTVAAMCAGVVLAAALVVVVMGGVILVAVTSSPKQAVRAPLPPFLHTFRPPVSYCAEELEPGGARIIEARVNR